MLKTIKRFVKEKIVETASISAIQDIVAADPVFQEIWEHSLEIIPDFGNHFSYSVEKEEIEKRIRLLIVAETAFVKQAIEKVIQKNRQCHYVDIGDSDGSVRLLLQKYFDPDCLRSVGVNLQEGAVEKMRERGLEAICEDALTLSRRGENYDVVSVFETLEHLPDPIGFLMNIRSIVKHKLVLSVPFIRQSRVGLYYMTEKWEVGKKATVENTHIFELSTRDWEKIFCHAGWKVEHERKLLSYPLYKFSRLILQPYWRWTSFEGFWFVSLIPDNQYSSQYSIE